MSKYPTAILCFTAEASDHSFVRLRVVGCTTYRDSGDDDFARLLMITVQAKTLEDAFSTFGQFWTIVDIEEGLASKRLALKTTSWVVPCALTNALLKLKVEAILDDDLHAPYSMLAFDDEYVYAGYSTSSELPKLPRRVIAGTFSMFVNYIHHRRWRETMRTATQFTDKEA